MMDYAKLLNTIVEKSSLLFEGIPEQAWNHKSNVNTWSKKEILGHLIDSAYNNHQRFIRAEHQGNLIFQGYDQVDWVSKHTYQLRDTEDIILQWRLSNLHLATLIGNVPSDVLNHSSSNHNFDQIGFQKVPSDTPSSLGYLIWDYLYHLEHHLAQILPSYKRALAEDSHPK